MDNSVAKVLPVEKNNTHIILVAGLFVKEVIAQELPTNSTTGKVSYSDIVSVTAQTKKTFISNARKWMATKNSANNPYNITIENEQEGTLIGKGSFSIGAEKKKYVIQFAINAMAKEERCKYELTDLAIQYRTQAGSSGGGFSYWGGSTYHEAENLEYTLETFYPSRLTSRKPAIKWYEEINKRAIETIDQNMQSIANSLKQTLSSKEDW